MSQVWHNPGGLAVSPLRFAAYIEPVIEPDRVGDWIVGTPSDEEGPLPQTYLDTFTGHEPHLRAWFEECIALKPFDPARWIGRHGAFREVDWKPVSKVLAEDFPAEVKKRVRDLGLPQEWKVYVLRVEHVRQELELLRYLTLIAGALKARKWPGLKDPLGKGEPLLSKLRAELGQGIYGQYKEIPVSGPGATPREWIANAHGLVKAAFTRVLGTAEMQFSSDPERGPGLNFTVRSVLSILYICLLANFSKEWKKCKRPDCPNIFVIESKRKKDYCTWYCGHLESVRRGRAPVAKRRIKRLSPRPRQDRTRPKNRRKNR